VALRKGGAVAHDASAQEPVAQGRPDRRRYANRILSALPPASSERLAGSLERVDLAQGAMLRHADAPMAHAYFLEQGLASLLKTMEDGRSIEVAAIGVEGMVGALATIGLRLVAPIDVSIQVPGFAWRLAQDTLKDATAQDRAFAALLRREAHRTFGHIVQIAACNGIHSVRERCCRWLLTAHDNAGSDNFPLTHEALADVLGVQRAGVSAVAGSLREAGFITYRHGRLTIVDRNGLERQACECYHQLRSQFDLAIADDT
jgi:CRP-like cAMP-binding protein